jgi:hypothetical protein
MNGYKVKKHAVSVCVFIFLLVLAIGSTETETQPQAQPQTQSQGQTQTRESLEYQLAVIHQGGFVAQNDPLVRQFAQALDRLEEKCPEGRQSLADMGVRGHELLQEGNVVDESLLEVFQNWRASIPDEVEKGELGQCSDILALYLTLRIGG